MLIGLFSPLTNPICDRDYIRILGETAESLGFDSLWVAEHIVLFDDYASQYPYANDGRIPVGGERGLLEPFTTLGYLAACTERIRLGTGICLGRARQLRRRSQRRRCCQDPWDSPQQQAACTCHRSPRGRSLQSLRVTTLGSKPWVRR